ncbi:MAG: outer membrane lipoprotein carrier protein LolA [Proteobacteria bacterium]|nr:outer membrane lipoprotein carrier protein LolA [Pseudomonadota bacterium]
MKFKQVIMILFLAIALPAGPLFGLEEHPAGLKEDTAKELNKVLNDVEKKYGGKGFCARFTQTAAIKAMDISDTATGKICAKPPGMMRWEYETPEPQLITTNGKELWVYRPEDNQVMVGKSPVFFEGGKGAGFLSDITLLRTQFDISIEPSEDPNLHKLKLLPRDKKLDVSVIYLHVSKKDASLARIVTFNAYDDETRVDLFDHEYGLDIDDGMFDFEIPKGVDILQLDEQEGGK